MKLGVVEMSVVEQLCQATHMKSKEVMHLLDVNCHLNYVICPPSIFNQIYYLDMDYGPQLGIVEPKINFGNVPQYNGKKWPPNL